MEFAQVRVGIIGCGRAAEALHLPALQGLRGLRAVAVADPDAARLDRVAERFGITRRFHDYRALLDDAEVDAVAVLTPPLHHAEIGLAAFEAGKHVLIEKPLALDPAECGRLIEGAARGTAKAMVGFHLRWHRLVRRARALLRGGVLGEIRAIRSVYTHRRPGAGAPAWHRHRESGGGVLFDAAVHHFDLWRFLLDREVTGIRAVRGASVPWDKETGAVAAQLTGSAVASGVFSFGTSPDNSLEVFGEHGRLVLSLYRFDGLELVPASVYPGDLGLRLRRAGRSLFDVPMSLWALRRGNDARRAFQAQWQHFAECIRSDRPVECTLEDGKRAVSAALAAVASAQQGAPRCGEGRR